MVAGGPAPTAIQVTATVTDLAPGVYAGSVLITPANNTPPLVIPVSLTVKAGPVIGVTPASVSFSYLTSEQLPPPPVTVQVTGGGLASLFTVQQSGASWLTVTPTNGVAPATLTLSVKPGALTPGTYAATITVTGTGSAKGSAVVAVALDVLTGSVTIAKVVNAASYQEGAIAPGELVTFFGSNLGPGTPALLTLDSSGKVATLVDGVQVLFDGTPAPLIYAGPTQVSAVAPYDLAGRSDTTVQVSFQGRLSNSVLVPVAATAPGVFTANASGIGPAAATTAPAGGVLTLYLTGEGQTVPAGVTGKVTEVSATPPLTPGPVPAREHLAERHAGRLHLRRRSPGHRLRRPAVERKSPRRSRPRPLPHRRNHRSKIHPARGNSRRPVAGIHAPPYPRC